MIGLLRRIIRRRGAIDLKVLPLERALAEIRIRLIEQEARGAKSRVVTSDAVLVECGALDRRWRGLPASGDDPGGRRGEQHGEGDSS